MQCFSSPGLEIVAQILKKNCFSGNKILLESESLNRNGGTNGPGVENWTLNIEYSLLSGKNLISSFSSLKPLMVLNASI